MRIHQLKARLLTNMTRPRTFRRGSTLIQTALVLPVLLSITFGTVEFGDYFWVKHNYMDAALAGANAACVAGASYSDVTAAVSNVLSSAKLNSNYTMTVKDNGTTISTLTSAAAGDQLTVTVAGTWGTVAGACRPMGLIGSSKQVLGIATMTMELSPTAASSVDSTNGGSPTANANGNTATSYSGSSSGNGNGNGHGHGG
jgi:Flp pilus assembly protein TadG